MNRVGLLVIFTATTLFPLGGQVESTSVSESLGLNKPMDTISAENLGGALLRFSSDWEIPTGIVWRVNPETLRPVRLTLQNASGKEVLRELLADFPEYYVRESQKYLWISPHNEEGDSASFLNLRIDHFEATNAALGLAWAKLRQKISREVKRARSPSPSRRGGIGSSIGVGLNDRKVNVDASDVPVAEILGMLAVSAGETSFIVTYPQDVSYTATGYRKTINFLGREIPSDEQQPSILFLPWEAIPKLISEIAPVAESSDPPQVP